MSKKPIPTKQFNDKVKQFLDESSLNSTATQATPSPQIVPLESKDHLPTTPKSEPAAGRKAKGRSISMTDEFDKRIDQFLNEFPDEGSRSQLIQRAVTFYIKKRRVDEKQYVV